MKKHIFVLFLFVFFLTSKVYSDGISDSNVFNFTKTDVEHKSSSSTVCIAANSKGEIAIGFSDDFINLYDSNGKYICSYAFKIDGSYFFNFDAMDNIMIFTVRGDTLNYFSENAELIRREKIDNHVYSDKFFREHSGVKKLNVKDNIYEVRSFLGYTKFLKIDPSGHETLLYETGSMYYSTLSFVVFILIFISIGICNVVRAFKDLKK